VAKFAANAAHIFLRGKAMTKTTKILGSTSGLLAVAAFSGLMLGATHTASAQGISAAKLAVSAGAKVERLQTTPPATHSCKGKNSCKGAGGCKTGDQGCKGKNSCKGNGGCKTDGSML
jgi:hypothetical protein